MLVEAPVSLVDDCRRAGRTSAGLGYTTFTGITT